MRTVGLYRVGSLRLRFLMILLLAAPALTGFPFYALERGHAAMYGLILWVLYGALIQLLIIWHSSADEWQRLFGLATGIAGFTALTGATIDFVTRGHYTVASRGTLGVTYLSQLLLILSVVPLALFVGRCFPVAEICERLRRRKKDVTTVDLLAFLTLRLLNHVTDVVARVMLIWREEMPEYIRPRAIESRPPGTYIPMPLMVQRVQVAVQAFVLTLIMGCTEPVPTIVAEFELLRHRGALT